MVQRALVCDVWFKSLSAYKQTNKHIKKKKKNIPTRLKTILSENQPIKNSVYGSYAPWGCRVQKTIILGFLPEGFVSKQTDQKHVSVHKRAWPTQRRLYVHKKLKDFLGWNNTTLFRSFWFASVDGRTKIPSWLFALFWLHTSKSLTECVSVTQENR